MHTLANSRTQTTETTRRKPVQILEWKSMQILRCQPLQTLGCIVGTSKQYTFLKSTRFPAFSDVKRKFRSTLEKAISYNVSRFPSKLVLM